MCEGGWSVVVIYSVHSTNTHPSFLLCYKSCLAVTVLHVMKKVYCKTSSAVKAYYSEGKVSVLLQVSGGDCAQEAVVTVVAMVLWMCNPMPYDWIVHVFIYTVQVVPFREHQQVKSSPKAPYTSAVAAAEFMATTDHPPSHIAPS